MACRPFEATLLEGTAVPISGCAVSRVYAEREAQQPPGCTKRDVLRDSGKITTMREQVMSTALTAVVRNGLEA